MTNSGPPQVTPPVADIAQFRIQGGSGGLTATGIQGDLIFGNVLTGGILWIVREGTNGTRRIIDGTNPQGTVLIGDYNAGDECVHIGGNPYLEFDNFTSGGTQPGFRWVNYNGTTNPIILGLHSVSGIFTTYAGIATAGLGVPGIFAVGAQTLYTNSAPTTLSYTPPATAGVYRIGGTLNILTGGTMTFKIKITYQDAGGNAHSGDIPLFALQNSATLLAGSPGANTTGRYTMLPFEIAIDNSATAITVADNSGTYTAGTYYWVPHIEQIA